MTDKQREHLRADLIRDEGLRLKPYTDTVGKITIGVGRNLTDRGLSEEEVMSLLDHDITLHVDELEKNLPWVKKLDDVRYRVLANMAFNLGIGKLLKFTQMLAAAQAGDYATAAARMRQSKWYEQVKSRGVRLAKMMESGEEAK